MNAEVAAAADLQGWRRLHPLSPVVRSGRSLIVLVLLVGSSALAGQGDSNLTFSAVALGVTLVAGVISWLVTRWRVEGADLRIETGLLRRESQRYPLRQVQAIDVVQTGIARALGLAELRLRMAGGSSKGRLACLPVADAWQLREELLHLTAKPAEADPSGSQPIARSEPAAGGPVILEVPTGQLASSLLLSPSGLITAVYVVGAIVAMAAGAVPASGVVGGGAPFVLGFGSDVWRRFNGRYRQTLRESPHGLEVSSGLIQTTTEVLPVERIQAVRIVEPLLWRMFGWCRLEASVAGKATKSENQSEGRSRRPLLPVGTYAQAYFVLGLLLPDIAVQLTKPPARARWKAPLSYHRLAAGGNATCVATCSGRLRRVSHWVPLEKVQSLRSTQGPVQRRLRLATVHLDTAGARMRAALRDRDLGDAQVAMRDLPGACAAARRAAAIQIP